MTELNTMEDFQRDITYRLRKLDDRAARLTALMRDRFHDVELNVTVDPTTMEIVAVAAEFRQCPTGDCRNASARLAGLVGFTIGRGLNKKIMEVMGGGD